MSPRVRLIVVHDFYSRPFDVRRVALRRKLTQCDDITGWRTRPYHPRGIRLLIERKFNATITYWNDDLDDLSFANGVFFSALASGPLAERVGVHADMPVNEMVLLVYLTPNAPLDSGTSFWRHRRTGLTSWPTERDAKRLGTTRRALGERLERDSKVLNRWEEIDRVGNVFNRALLFQGGVLHSATRHFGCTIGQGRLYQMFHFEGEMKR